jgi:hypothetical protein
MSNRDLANTNVDDVLDKLAKGRATRARKAAAKAEAEAEALSATDGDNTVKAVKAVKSRAKKAVDVHIDGSIELATLPAKIVKPRAKKTVDADCSIEQVKAVKAVKAKAKKVVDDDATTVDADGSIEPATLPAKVVKPRAKKTVDADGSIEPAKVVELNAKKVMDV